MAEGFAALGTRGSQLPVVAPLRDRARTRVASRDRLLEGVLGALLGQDRAGALVVFVAPPAVALRLGAPLDLARAASLVRRERPAAFAQPLATPGRQSQVSGKGAHAWLG